MTGGLELTDVESPFLDQLAAMDWKVITGSVDDPSVTGRDTFRADDLNADILQGTGGQEAVLDRPRTIGIHPHGRLPFARHPIA